MLNPHLMQGRCVSTPKRFTNHPSEIIRMHHLKTNRFASFRNCRRDSVSPNLFIAGGVHGNLAQPQPLWSLKVLHNMLNMNLGSVWKVDEKWS